MTIHLYDLGLTGCYSLNQLTNAVYEDIHSEGVVVTAQLHSGLFTVGVLLSILTIIHKTQLQRRLFMVLQLTCFIFQLQKIKQPDIRLSSVDSKKSCIGG